MHKNIFCMQKMFSAKLFIKNENPGSSGAKKKFFMTF